MQYLLLKPLIVLLDGLLFVTELLRAALGALRFFLATGVSWTYLRRRKRWFEAVMLGRPMRLSDFLEFGAWHAELIVRRRASFKG